MESITIICDSSKCTGCYACYNTCDHSAISMITDNEGFSRPKINSYLCIGCKKCQKVCPVNNPVERNEIPLTIYSGWSKNEDIRLSSASGGAFTELAKFFIEQMHGVVFGVAMNEKLEACHIAVEFVDDLSKLQGSKYIQSNINESYRQTEHYLKEGKNVLFSGTPCQIAGLKNYLRKEYQQLYTVDLICHGVPSKRLFEDYIKHLESKLQHRVYDVKFRCKKSSWIFFNMAVNSHVEEKTRKISYEYEGAYYSDPFIRGFLRDNALRPSCYQCQYTSTKRVSDFTLADWWGYKAEDKCDKDFEKKGVSLIFTNTSKGQYILPQLNMLLKERTLEAALMTNISLQKPFTMPGSRQKFWQDYARMNFSDIVDKWLKPEQMKPMAFIRYKLPDTYLRRILMFVCHIYEKICKVFKFNVLTIRA